MNRAAALALVLAGAAVVAGAACDGGGGGGEPRAHGPRLRISSSLPGAMPADVMEALGEPIERAAAGVRGVAHVETRATMEHVTVELRLASGAEPMAVSMAVREALDGILKTLPPLSMPPLIERIAGGTPVLIALDAETAAMQVALLARTPLSFGERCGLVEEGYVAELDPARLAARDLTVLEVEAALRTPHVSIPMGRVDDDGQVIRVLGRGGRNGHDASALGEVPLRDGVRLADVAAVRAETAGCRSALDGKPRALVEVTPVRGGKKLAAVLAELAPELPPGDPPRVLDGPAIHGVYEADAEQARKAIGAARAALTPPRWFATRIDPEAGRLTISIGLAPDQQAAQVAGAIDRGVAGTAWLAAGRWSGPGLVEARALVTGDDAREVAGKVAAGLRGQPGVGGSGCDPCLDEPTLTVRLDRTRAAALGARADDVTRTIAIGGGNGPIVSDPPVRLTLPERAPPGSLLVRTPSGLVPIDALATFEQRVETEVLLHVDGRPAVEVWVRGDGKRDRAALQRTLDAAIRR